MAKSILIPRDDNGADYQCVREELAETLTLDGTARASAALQGASNGGPAVIGLFATEPAWYEHWNGEGSTPDPSVTGVPLGAEGVKYASTPAGWKIVVKKRGADDGVFVITYGR